MEQLFSKILEKLSNTKPGFICAGVFFVIGLLLCIFGFWKTLFIIVLTLVGFFVGSYFFSEDGRFKKILDKILPPGRFR